MEPQSTATRRLVRRSQDRYVAGVAGGVADYFAIDPVLVRIAFVVLTFVGGAGAIAYAAGWLLIPEEGEDTSLGENAVRNHNWGRIAGFVLIAIAASLLLRPLWWFGGQLITAVALILARRLPAVAPRRRRPGHGHDDPAATASAPTAPTASAADSADRPASAAAADVAAAAVSARASAAAARRAPARGGSGAGSRR